MVKQILTDWQKEDAVRLNRLWNERKPKGMTQIKFGLDYDMGTQANVNLYLKGKSRLKGLGVVEDNWHQVTLKDLNAPLELSEEFVTLVG